jgi:phosphatidylethanolamine/phosphatidyl-N-methylethanolamine N-methyltransferase
MVQTGAGEMAKLKDYGHFVMQFVRSPRTTGAIAPSSRALADCMLDELNLRDASVVCEFGPGTGVFTQALMERIGPKTRLFAIEKNPAMVNVLRSRFPSIGVYEESILNVDQICQREGVKGIDVVVCGLPWASFDADFQMAGLEATWNALVPNGRFVTFAYSIGKLLPSGRRFARTLKKQFTVVAKSHVVWGNLPPAFVYRCVK